MGGLPGPDRPVCKVWSMYVQYLFSSGDYQAGSLSEPVQTVSVYGKYLLILRVPARAKAQARLHSHLANKQNNCRISFSGTG